MAAGQPVLTALPALELASLASVADPWLDYLPRPLLSRAPQALAPVMLEWPDVTVDKDQYQAVLALYIDESGLVRDAKLDDGELPAALLEVARQAFLATRFAPGEWGGQAVKSRVLVELSYEQDPATRVAARGVNGAGQR
ncbi:hypothetical protein [Roseateles aquae]|uniref:hypothetical protein n=1 Tax=Roseateles aquae TaxID=3077235 RepID=UPI0028ECE9F8|nr:hypothetical protein [Paucibacter sp. APW11]